jgi:hypothetical protein
MQARGQIPSERFPGGPASSKASADSLTDAQLRQLFEAERDAQIGNAKFRATRNLVSGILFIVLAGVLFTIHWRWLRGVMATANTV